MMRYIKRINHKQEMMQNLGEGAIILSPSSPHKWKRVTETQGTPFSYDFTEIFNLAG